MEARIEYNHGDMSIRSFNEHDIAQAQIHDVHRMRADAFDLDNGHSSLTIEMGGGEKERQKGRSTATLHVYAPCSAHEMLDNMMDAIVAAGERLQARQ